MSEKNTGSLIGYDPLAWMNEKADERQITPKMPDTQQLAKTENLTLTNAPEGWGLENETSPSRQLGGQDFSVLYTDRTVEGRGGEDIATPAEQSPNLSSAVSTIALDPVLNIRDVGTLHERFLTALDSSEKIEIDASAVTAVDTATLQLLLILKRTAINSQKQVVIDFPSERFIEASTLLGISEMLELNQAFAGLF